MKLCAVSCTLVAILFFAVAISCKQQMSSQPKEIDHSLPPYETFSKELNPIISPVESVDPNSLLDDMATLSYLGDAQVVGLGEATHGTKEFFQLKHKIFKYLVKEHGFKVFAFEADMGESYYFEKYITEGTGDLAELMKNKMHFWTWYTKEVKALLQWMRDYNKGKPDEEKVHYVGVDSQFLTFQPTIIETYLQENKPSLLDKVEPVLNIITDLNDEQNSTCVPAQYDTMSIEYKETIDDRMDDIIEILDNNETSLIEASSNFEFQYIRQLTRNIQQTNDVFFAIKNNEHPLNRDKYMAENTLWVHETGIPNSKVALWAHNGHVSNDDTYGTNGSQGYHLKKAFGEKYKVVGFGFSKGSFRAIGYENGNYTQLENHSITSSPEELSLNKAFSNLKQEDFILNLSDIPEKSKFYEWSNVPRQFLSIGAVYNGTPSHYYRLITLREHYDTILYFNWTTAADALDYQSKKKVIPRYKSGTTLHRD